MATVMNDRDNLLLNATQRTINPLTATILLTSDSPTFHVSSGGTTSPLQITVTAHLIGITGTASFTATGATVVDNGNNTATIDYASVTSSTITVNASVTSNGQTFNATTTISKVTDGADGNGTPGAPGDLYAIAYLYKWSTIDVANPTGSSTFDWASGVNTIYSGTDNWSVTPPSNPSDPGIRLYVASVSVTAAGGTSTSTVFYNNATVQYWSSNGQNGSPGAPGAPGIKSFTVKAFQWANGPAPTATGTATFTWAGTSYDNAPSGTPNNWSKTKPAAPGPGFTLYEADVNIVETAGAATSPIDWTTANVVGTSYMGVDGSGSTGASAMIAYTLVDGFTLATTPSSVTLDGHPLPLTGTWGETRAWTSQPSVPAAGQSVSQSNGIYDPNTNKVTWGLPYLSNLRVGALSSLTENTGDITFTGTAQSANGKIQLHADGSAVFQAITIENPDGSVILQAGGQLNPANAAPGTLNSDLTPAISSAAATAQWPNIGGAGKPADNATVGATWGSDIANQPYDVSNLIKKGNFDDGSYGGWQVDGIENVVSSGNGFPYAKNIWLSRRDCLEANNSIPVTPGETLYFAAWMESTLTDYPCDFGVFEYDKNGNITNYSVAVGINPRTGWTYVTGGHTIAPGTATVVPWILMSDSYQGFTDANGTPNQFLRVAGLWIGRHAPGATVGAPAGTNVGSTLAETVESNAAAGKSASDAIPGINNTIATKLSATSASSLAATVTLTTGGSILAGDTNNGTYHSPSGFYGVQGGVVKFSVPISGDPTFAGQLAAAYGTFGAISIASGGSFALQATSYNNDQGVWFGYVSGVPKFSIVASNGAKLLFDPTLTNALQIINATVSGANKPSVTLTNHASGNYANGTTSYGGITLTITNGTAPFSVSWACNDSGNVNKLGISSSDNTGASIKSVSGSTTNSTGTATVSVTVVDANGIAATGSVLVNITCGTGA